MLKDQVIGVSVHTDGDRPELRWVRIKRSGKQVIIVGSGTATDALHLKKQCGTRAPLAIAFDTPRCLHRSIASTGTIEELVVKAFPGAALEHLHVSAWQDVKGSGLSMTRREGCGPVLQELRATGFRIVKVGIGPWAILTLRPVTSDTAQDETIAGYSIPVNPDGSPGLPTQVRDPGMFTIGSDELPVTHALALATAWHQIIPSPALHHLPTPDVNEDHKEEKARINYEWGLLGLAATLLLLLIIDQGLQTLVGSRQQDGTGVEVRAQLQEQVRMMKEQLKERNDLVKELGLADGERFAIRASRLLEDVPKEIQLDQLIIDPMLEALRENNYPEIELGKIRLIGTCTDGLVLNSWIHSLRMRAGVQDVRLIGYTDDIRSGRPKFQIELNG